MAAAKRLWPAYPWRIVIGLPLLVVAGWFIVDVLTLDSAGILAKAVFGAMFGVIALFAVQLIVCHLVLTDDRLEVRAVVFRRLRVDRADVVSFSTRPYNHSFVISVECTDGKQVRLPLLIQGSRRSQERLLRELEGWAFPEDRDRSTPLAPG